jgi:cell wall-associated NlpC family hydrolase
VARATQVVCATAISAGWLAPAVVHADPIRRDSAIGGGADGPEAIARQMAVLYRQAEADTQEYDAAEERIARLQAAVADSGRRSGQLRDQLAAATGSLGRLAAEQYRDAGLSPSMALVLWAHPDSYLERAGMTDRLAAVDQQRVRAALSARRALDALMTESAADLADLRAAQLQAAGHRADVEAGLVAARARLNALGSADRRSVAAALARTGDGDGTGAAVPSPPRSLGALLSAIGTSAEGATAAPDGADTSRAVRAVVAAYAEIGKPYVWGAAGPDDFDCSGLTQHAWAAAGVRLPRTSQEQADAGTPVPVSAIRPGDLVVYFSGRTHIGIYVGRGVVIHAPHPGAVVQFAPLNSMPIDKIVRPVL